jgi:glyoxylate/hydroxypyruvate reductase A
MNLLLVGSFDDGEGAAWAEALRRALPAHRLLLDREPGVTIDVAVIANPPPGSLRGLAGLRLIQSLWAGVDRLLGDDSVPAGVPIARMVDPAMNEAMAETALWATLSLQRGFFRYADQQRQALWRLLPQPRADEWPVLLLGYGQMGRQVARRLAQQGYPVTAWRRGTAAAAEAVPGVMLCAGRAELHQALAGARVLINLLPLTADTRGLIDGGLLARLPRGAAVVNLARGAHLVDADLLAALDCGAIEHAVLDVFHVEPLPPQHPYWRHAKVTVLPHAAALTDLRSAAAVVAANIEVLACGGTPSHLVRREAGY